ncbi:MAG: FtsX-like permease family protein [Gemmatimonadaceae bacterium]
MAWPQTDILVNMGSIPDLPFDERDSSFGTRIYARLANGVSFASAQADLARSGREIVAQNGGNSASPSLRSLQDYLIGSGTAQLWLLLSAVFLVLLIATVNVGGLLFARAEERRRELATRIALGASRRAIVRQLGGESAALALAGGTLGLIFGAALLRPLITLLPSDMAPVLVERVRIDALTATARGSCVHGIRS